ncbi:ribulose-phosphate 3-epimerase [Patescibacteria group bacterium]|nr:ribulose-phosphate 3-epimerase [Patescibacteria group bacterium]
MQKVIPAILATDPADLQEKLQILKGNTNWVHIDIMDGKFVPNTSVNLFELGEAAQRFNLEIHLMVQEPEKYFEDCAAISAKRVICHWEVKPNLLGEHPFQKGIALNPETELPAFEAEPSSILLMSVHPGFQGQEFVSSVLEKAKQVREKFPEMLVGMDGALGEKNIKQAFDAGINYAVVGSNIVKAESPAEALKNLEEMIRE